MTLEQIEYYVVAVECGSFSGAAGRLFVSHSSVSRGVAVLESELGVRLLNRGKRTLQCTEAGEIFYRQAAAFLRQAAALRDSVAEYRERRTLQVVSVGIHAPRFFELCRKYQQAHPGVELVLEQTDLRSSLEKLRSGSADLCATFSYSLRHDDSFATLTLEQGRFCALVSPGHELAGREWLADEDLARRPDILGANPLDPDRETRRELTQSVESILLRIKAGNGITVLPEHTAAEFGQGCVRIPIRGQRTEYELVLAWGRDNPSKTLREAVSFFQEQLAPAIAPETLPKEV